MCDEPARPAGRGARRGDREAELLTRRTARGQKLQYRLKGGTVACPRAVQRGSSSARGPLHMKEEGLIMYVVQRSEAPAPLCMASGQKDEKLSSPYKICVEFYRVFHFSDHRPSKKITIHTFMPKYRYFSVLGASQSGWLAIRNLNFLPPLS